MMISILTVLACCKDTPESPPPGPKKLEVVWKTPIIPEGSFNSSLSMNPVLYDDVVIFNSEYTLNGYNAPVMFLDTVDGAVMDYWSDYSDGPFAYTHESMAFEGQYLFLSGQRSVDCINMQTRQTQWNGAIADNSPFIYTNNGYLYRGIEYNGQNPNNNSAAVMRTPVDQMNWDTVYAFDKTDNRTPAFSSMGFGTLINGDEVVVWKNRSYVPGNGTLDRTDIFAYNLTADTLMWRNMDFNEGSGIIPLKIDNGVVYGLFQYNAVAIDLQSGTTLWNRDFRTVNTTIPNMQFFGGDLHVEGDRILIRGESSETVALKKSNGTVAWMANDQMPYAMDDRFTYFEGKLFFTSHELVIVDVMTGQRLVSKNMVDHLGDVESRVVVDPTRRVMYMHNGKEALCVRIPPDL